MLALWLHPEFAQMLILPGKYSESELAWIYTSCKQKIIFIWILTLYIYL